MNLRVILAIACLGVLVVGANRLEAATVSYTATFDATWSQSTHPNAYPAGAHFSALIGGVHNDRVSFWTPGSLASSGIDVQSVVVRRLLMGVAMGSTAIFLVYSGWGQQSGAHFNPAVTLTYFQLQRVPGPDAAWYVLSQMLGALLAVGIMVLLFRPWLSHPAIHYVSAMPGPYGAGVTWATEFVASFLLMTIVLIASNSGRFARWTGVFVGLLTVANVSVLVPLVGTSLNPARSLASAVPAHVWSSIWIYLTAAPTGMLAAAAFYLRRCGTDSVFCAKLHHQNDRRCIFCESQAV